MGIKNKRSIRDGERERTTPGLLLFSEAGNGANRVPFPAVFCAERPASCTRPLESSPCAGVAVC